MKTAIYLLPDDVSFSNVEYKEDEVSCTATGFWKRDSGQGHEPNPDWLPMTEKVVPGKGTFSEAVDMANSGWYDDRYVKPPFAGAVKWEIPWRFRVQGDSGNGKVFAMIVQSVSTDDTGSTTISKGRPKSWYELGQTGIASATFKMSDPEKLWSPP